MIRDLIQKLKQKFKSTRDESHSFRPTPDGEATWRAIEQHRTKHYDYPSPYRERLGPPECHPWMGRWFL